MNFNGQNDTGGFTNPFPDPVIFESTVNVDGTLTLGETPNAYTFPPNDAGALVGQVLQYQGGGVIDFVTSTGPLDNTLTSPDTLTTLTVGNAATTISKSGHTRFNVDATNSQFISPNGNVKLSTSNTSINGGFASAEQLLITSSSAALYSPDMFTSFIVSNDDIRGEIGSQIVIESNSTDTTLFDPSATLEFNLGTSVIPLEEVSFSEKVRRITSKALNKPYEEIPLGDDRKEAGKESLVPSLITKYSGTTRLFVSDTITTIGSPDSNSLVVTQNGGAILDSDGIAVISGKVNQTNIGVDDALDLIVANVDNNNVLLVNSTSINLKSPDQNMQLSLQNGQTGSIQNNGVPVLSFSSTQTIATSPDNLCTFELDSGGNSALKSTGGQISMIGNNSGSAFYLNDSSGNITFATTSVAEIQGLNSGAALQLNDSANTITMNIAMVDEVFADSAGGHLFSADGNSTIEAIVNHATVQSNGIASLQGTVNPTTAFNVYDTVDTVGILVDNVPVFEALTGSNVILQPTDASSTLILSTTTGNSALQYTVTGNGTQLNVTNAISSLLSPDSLSTITSGNGHADIVSSGQAAMFGQTNSTTGFTMDDGADSCTIDQDGTHMIQTLAGPILKVNSVQYPSSTGAAGQVLTLSSSTVADWVTPVITPSIFSINQQTFTRSSTYTPSANMVYCIARGCGSGGGGGGAASSAGNTAGSSGGGAGAYGELAISAATIGVSQPVTIGAAGTGGNGLNPGTSGSASGIGVANAIMLLNPGSGGNFGGNGQPTTGGAGGTVPLGTTGNDGGQGLSGYGINANILIPACAGGGGSSSFGYGFPSFFTNASTGGQTPSTNSYGCGGTGCISYNGGAAQTGGDGSQGIIIITEYIIT